MARRRTSSKRNKKGTFRGKPFPFGRAADHPFCAYLGAAGETCAQTANLEEVLVINGPPRLAWVACPRHQEEVRQMAAAFVRRSQAAPLSVPFRYQGQPYEVWVTGMLHTSGSSDA